ncbi:hypothetical protein [Halalkalibacter urbisdiaboli]|uniref:hypothetical protein n=1 Tax=Halalkalibacter urbisdiaboli TaxID=1960589 RepID=UPI000B44AE19|nr:hypothetical protein [Halalkalibacter urbisdiaboli]
MTCPAETNRDILRVVLDQEEPIIELLGLEVFLELCLVIRTEEGSLIDPDNLTPEQIMEINRLLRRIRRILVSTLPRL